MRLIEIIEVRSIKNKQILDKIDLQTLLKNEKYGILPITIKLYKHKKIDTDFSIHLQYDLKNEMHMNDSCGAYVASLLKEWGLVNYSIWIEKERLNQSHIQGGNDEKD